VAGLNLYNKIHQDNIAKISSGEIQIDDILNNRQPDQRIGVGLIISVANIKDNYCQLVSQLKTMEPNQYYYPFTDLHITVFEYLVGDTGYQPNPTLEKILIELSAQVLNIKAFEINYSGICFSNGAGLIQGFDRGKLITLRNRIRPLLKKYHIPNQERYQSKSAHATFCRFTNNLTNPSEFSKLISQSRHYQFGSQKVTQIQLVEHDWYNSSRSKRIITSFNLN